MLVVKTLGTLGNEGKGERIHMNTFSPEDQLPHGPVFSLSLVTNLLDCGVKAMDPASYTCTRNGSKYFLLKNDGCYSLYQGKTMQGLFCYYIYEVLFLI